MQTGTLPDGLYDLQSLNAEISIILINTGFVGNEIQFLASSATGFVRLLITTGFSWDSLNLGKILGFTNNVSYSTNVLGTIKPSFNLNITSLFIELANLCKNKSWRNSFLPNLKTVIVLSNYVYSFQLLQIPNAKIEIESKSLSFVNIIASLSELDHMEVYIRDQNSNIINLTTDSELHLIIENYI